MPRANGQHPPRRLQPRLDLVIEKNGREWLSLRMVILLEAIDARGSISAAAHAARMPYRNAWDKLGRLERSVGRKLLRRQAGGRRGGGTRLTPAGRQIVAKFRSFAANLEQQVERQFRRVYRA